jgi:thiol-disulfide isomerase/thioredoxin
VSERDPVIALLEGLDRPAVPRVDFADTLRERLLADLSPTNGAAPAPTVPRPRRAFSARRLRPVFAGLALAAVVAAVVAVVVSRPAPASALDVIHDARLAFAEAPPFQAALRAELDPDGSVPDVPKGATSTVVISYDGKRKFRSEIAAIEPPFPTSIGVGSYRVYDGRTIASFDSKANHFTSTPAPRGYAPLRFFSWQSRYPNWDRLCRGPDSKVLPDTRIAGRDARHIQCGDFQGERWELWIDKEMGLLLKIVGAFGGDDFFGNLGAGGAGGYEVERLRLDPRFPARTFSVEPPQGAVDFMGRLRTATARVPPVHVVISGRSRRKTYTRELWWRDSQTWRVESHGGSGGSIPVPTAAGSFSVAAQGKERTYDAGEKVYFSSAGPGDFDPIWELLPQIVGGYPTAGCKVVGRDRIAGRMTVRRQCRKYDVWLDASTGLTLRHLTHSHRYEQRVRRIRYRPVFPPGTFRFVPPPGAVTQEERSNDAYHETKLAPGRVPPNWSGTRLGGGRFELTDLRGNPALLLFLADWCPPTDDACQVFEPLKQAYEHSDGSVRVVWVNGPQGRAAMTRRIEQHNHLPFPAVTSSGNSLIKAWKVQAVPFWVLLDARGRVIEARLKPQTTAQLEQLLARAKR